MNIVPSHPRRVAATAAPAPGPGPAKPADAHVTPFALHDLEGPTPISTSAERRMYEHCYETCLLANLSDGSSPSKDLSKRSLRRVQKRLQLKE